MWIDCALLLAPECVFRSRSAACGSPRQRFTKPTVIFDRI
jgi:hypothetical protein